MLIAFDAAAAAKAAAAALARAEQTAAASTAAAVAAAAATSRAEERAAAATAAADQMPDEVCRQERQRLHDRLAKRTAASAKVRETAAYRAWVSRPRELDGRMGGSGGWAGRGGRMGGSRRPQLQLQSKAAHPSLRLPWPAHRALGYSWPWPVS